MTASRQLMTARYIQTAMATAYMGLGAWVLFSPATVITMCFVPDYAITNRATTLMMQCFGAQAMTCGLVLGTATMTSRSFTIFATAMVAYLVAFNGWFGIGPGKGLITNWMWLDFVGNVFFFLGFLYCASLLKEQEDDDRTLTNQKQV